MVDETPGYADTPKLPNSEYRVHDQDRPRPTTVTPPAGGGDPSAPSDATVLFEGTDLAHWEPAYGDELEWSVTEEYIEVTPDSGDIRTTETFGDCHLHVEWCAPTAIDGDGQGRGNSGVFLMDRYEIQVLDNYENPTYADGYAGAVYGQQPPLVNACREPGEWQTYDILWTAPRFENGDLASPGEVTVLHNGLLIQDETELIGPTDHREVAEYEPHEPREPIRLQDHGDRVRFRNIWVRER